jgi:hypothetical protein
VLVGIALAPSRARAEGLAGASPSLFPASGNVRGGAELETAAFNLEGQRGSYASAIARLEWAATDDLGLRIRMPFATLTLEGQEGTREGAGDAELRLRYQLLGQDPLKLSVGWVVQLPTGARRYGLGEGATQVTPFVSAGYKVGRTILYLTLGDNLSLAGVHRERLPNYLDPSEDHEVRATAGAIFTFSKAVYASAVLTETTILTSAQWGQSLLAGAVQLGVEPDRRLRLVLVPQLPLLGEQRFSWKLSAAATYAF